MSCLNEQDQYRNARLFLSKVIRIDTLRLSVPNLYLFVSVGALCLFLYPK